jgi:hypothetical protein
LAKYHFSKDETKLIVFSLSYVGGISVLTVLVWDNLPTERRLYSHAKLRIGSFIGPSQIVVHKDEKSALFVTESLRIQRVELGEVVSFPEADDMNDEYPHSFSSVSADGRMWASVSYGPFKGQVQLVDLDLCTAVRRLELEWTPCNSGLVVVGLSPDLSVLTIDAQVYDLGQHERIAAYPFTITGLPEVLECRRRSEGISATRVSLACRISPCNSYILYFSRGRIKEPELDPTELHLFRIDLMSKSSAKMHVPVPENLVFMSAKFHPSLPQMSLGYAAASEAEHGTLLDPETEGPQLNLAILELGSSEAQPIGIPESLIPSIRE